MATVSLNHASACVHDPERAARVLAALVGGAARPFPPCEGAYFCFLTAEEWRGPFLELYPADVAIVPQGQHPGFAKDSPRARGGTHFNVSVPRTREALEARCRELGVACSWRGSFGLLDVWVDEALVVELVPAGAP